MKFSYDKLLLPHKSEFFGTSIARPIISICISSGGRLIRYSALIDSGADFCIFDGEVGDYLGIDVRAGSREVFGGVQERGGAEAFLHEITLNVGGWDYQTTVGFSYDIAKHGSGILGQKGFFDMFSIKFDLVSESIELKESNKK